MGAVVLIAESDPRNLAMLQEVCEAAGYVVLTACERTGALAAVTRRRPDLIVVDVSLPGSVGTSGGLEVLRALKADRGLSSIPVLVTTGTGDDEARRASIELGAEDYLARPYRVFEIHARVRNTLRRALLERLSDNDLEAHVAGTPGQLPVTLEYEMSRAVRFGHALACVSILVPGLRRLRDSWSGDAWRGESRIGDAWPSSTASTASPSGSPSERAEALFAELAARTRSCIRGIDHLFRASSDELVAILPETSEADAAIVVGRIRERLEREAGPVEIGAAGRLERGIEEPVALLSMARRARAS